MSRFILFILIFLLSSIARAEDYRAIAVEAEKHRLENIQEYLKIAEEAKNQENKAIINNKVEVEAISKKEVLNSKSHPEVIIFISFSLPQKSIVSLLQDAKRIHASVVIRGLIHNSFKETFTRMASIIKEAGNSGVELNPLLFRKYQINKVPAVVIPSNQACDLEKICSSENFDVVYGDIPVLNGLKIIRDHGNVSNKKAEELTLIMEESLHV
jgi:conjugal transfer pilus assembly protein TrbC